MPAYFSCGTDTGDYLERCCNRRNFSALVILLCLLPAALALYALLSVLLGLATVAIMGDWETVSAEGIGPAIVDAIVASLYPIVCLLGFSLLVLLLYVLWRSINWSNCFDRSERITLLPTKGGQLLI